ncbi:hypothetical protein [Clostridium autoethanogenum]|uniref:hypothetical protein n=1 Tax=Clostridium autoethanogenum TaxID=84023 RepID=UPI001604ED6C|nr:hypothetical protein [Clostridium autoethanogenum]
MVIGTEQEKAKKRQATSTGGKEPQLRDNVPQAEVDNVPQQVEQGKTRDIIAEKANIR